jgi:hypothetical protein
MPLSAEEAPLERMSLKEFFAEMVASYAVADFEKVADCFLLPSAIFFNEDVILLQDRKRLMSMMREQCSRNYTNGVRRLNVRIPAQSLSRGNNYSVWAHWEHFNADGVLMSIVPVRYICQDDALGVPRIQLVELLELPECYSQEDVRQMSEQQRRLG